MAAFFYTYDTDRDLFKGGISFTNVVKVYDRNGNDMLGHMLNNFGMTIITNVQVSNSDIVQYFLTFDDVISYFFFGKGLGTIAISGVMFANCDGTMPGVSLLYSVIGEQRGLPVVVSLGGHSFKGIISNFTTTTTADPEPVTEFQLNLNIIHHEIGSSIDFQSQC